ncbi:aminodeoxychorismate lyase [Motiliproteus sediminis]|uniref:aminodeoxychorismate lyase n=1 Tax=Motiliproteus sediminis TaxID=1468178 RepID=UPI001AEFE86D|nr:aminodeoxychorismate lyase [Motiliproteus sediminis]
MTLSVLVDGAWVDALPVDDRGLAYGDGVFETIAIIDGKPRWLHRHLERLLRGCERLLIPHDGLADRLHADIMCLLSQSPLMPPVGVVKLIVTRGSSGRGYAVDRSAAPRRIVRLSPAPDYPGSYLTEGVAVRLCQTRLAEQPQLAGIKHLNRLEQVLARMELAANEQEGLLCDYAGRVVEGTCSNLFAHFGACLVTPSLSRSGVAGIAREVVIERARRCGVTVEIDDLTVAQLVEADALVLTNSLIGAWPVAQFHGHRYDSIAAAHTLRDWITGAEAG